MIHGRIDTISAAAFERFINAPKLPSTPLERFYFLQDELKKTKRSRKNWTFAEAFLQSFHEEVATELLCTSGLPNNEIARVSGASIHFVQTENIRVRRSREYNMRRDPQMRKLNWYSYLQKS